MTKSNTKDNIKNIIMKLKLSSDVSADIDLANIFNVDKATFSNWKNKNRIIPIDYLIDFCDNYEVSLDWLLRGDGILKNQASGKNIKIPYADNFQDERSKKSIILPMAIIKVKNEYMNIRAVRSKTNELPISSPIDSIMMFDFDSKSPNTSPWTYVFKANETIFIRKVSIITGKRYMLTSENKDIRDEIVKFEEIEIIARFIGSIKWSSYNEVTI